MRRLIYILIAVTLLVLSLSVFIKPIIIFFVKTQLQNISKDSGVSIEGFDLKRLSLLSIIRARISGDFHVSKIKYNKLIVDDIQGSFLLKGKHLFLNSLNAHALEGNVSGDSGIIIDKNTKYSLNLKFAGLDMEKFVDDFDLKEKFQLSGKLNGMLTLSGEGADIKALSGDFLTVGTGGILIISDNKFIENLAENSGQSLELLVESFQDYHYNTGMMKLSFDKGNLLFDVTLEGDAGKRNLNIILHDFKIRKGDL